MTGDDLDVVVAQSTTVPNHIYVMVYHQTLSVAMAKVLVRKLMAEISEAARRRPCVHPHGMSACSWCGQQGDDA